MKTWASYGIAAALALGGCAGDVAKGVTVGETRSQLVAQIGAPTNVSQDGDTQILSYRRTQTAELPGSGLTVWGTQFQPMVDEPSDNSLAPKTVATGVCTTQFRVVGDRVQSWQHSGISC